MIKTNDDDDDDNGGLCLICLENNGNDDGPWSWLSITTYTKSIAVILFKDGCLLRKYKKRKRYQFNDINMNIEKM